MGEGTFATDAITVAFSQRTHRWHVTLVNCEKGLMYDVDQSFEDSTEAFKWLIANSTDPEAN